MTIEPRVRVPDPSRTRLDKPAYRNDVQGLRALAVVLVVLYHADFGFGGGFVGVDAFFVISGFVITRGVLWELDTTGQIDVMGFFRRRIIRILPAATFMTVIVALAATFFSPITHRATALNSAIFSIAFNANNYFAAEGVGGSDAANYFDPATELNPFLHTWSLSVEEQFYLVYPIVVFAAVAFARRTGRSGRSVLFALVIVGMLLSFAASIEILSRSQVLAFYLSPVRAWEFLAGAALAWRERRWSAPVTSALSVAGLALLLGSGWFFAAGDRFPGWLALLPVAGTVLLIAAGSGQTGLIQRALNKPGAGYIGEISYGWYLWHWPLIVFARATLPRSTFAVVAAVVGSLLIAAVSSHFLENPVRHSSAIRRKAPLVFAGCICLSIIGAVGATAVVRSTEASTVMAQFDHVFRPDKPQSAPCERTLDAVPECTGGSSIDNPDADERVLLLGDSTALQLFPGLSLAADDQNKALTIAFRHSCSSDGVVMELRGDRYTECEAFWDGALAEIEQDPPDTIVLASALEYYVSSDTNTVQNAAGDFVSEPDERAEIYGPAFVDLVDRLTSMVDNVVYVGITPTFDEWRPEECSFAVWRSNAERCGPTRSRADVDQTRAYALEVQDQIVATPGVEFLDLDPLLCPGDPCSTERDGEWIFSDSRHITANTSESLAPVLAFAIDDSDE